jgi:hypothetical protein
MLTCDFPCSKLDALIHMYGLCLIFEHFKTLTWSSDAENPSFVYEWRQEQERTLRATKGTGMTEEQVNQFVDGCAYIFERWTCDYTNCEYLKITHRMSFSPKLSVRAHSSLVCIDRRHRTLNGKADSFVWWSIVIGEFRRSLRFDLTVLLHRDQV